MFDPMSPYMHVGRFFSVSIHLGRSPVSFFAARPNWGWICHIRCHLLRSHMWARKIADWPRTSFLTTPQQPTQFLPGSRGSTGPTLLTGSFLRRRACRTLSKPQPQERQPSASTQSVAGTCRSTRS